jgi:hypothetical protein
MVTLKEESINNNINAPKNIGGNIYVKNSELGMKNMAMAETIAPPRMNGILRPNLVQVLSLDKPTIG